VIEEIKSIYFPSYTHTGVPEDCIYKGGINDHRNARHPHRDINFVKALSPEFTTCFEDILNVLLYQNICDIEAMRNAAPSSKTATASREVRLLKLHPQS
jgi:hypothetical protein